MIPHDGQMSGKHAALRQTTIKDKLCWSLADLKSTNGTFVRVGHAVLEDGSEFIIGRTRLHFESKLSGQSNLPKANSAAEQATQLWQPPASVNSAAAIVEMTADGVGRRVMLNQSEVWLGKDAGCCQLVLAVDPYASTGTREFVWMPKAAGCLKTISRSTVFG